MVPETSTVVYLRPADNCLVLRCPIAPGFLRNARPAERQSCLPVVPCVTRKGFPKGPGDRFNFLTRWKPPQRAMSKRRMESTTSTYMV